MLFLWGGYLFGNIPVVKQNFGIVTILIIVVSLIPLVVTFFQSKRETA
jgi:membrane-associated protein